MTATTAHWLAIAMAISSSPNETLANNTESTAAPNGWKIEWRDNQCNLTSETAGSPKLTLRMLPGGSDPDVWIVGARAIVPYDGRVWYGGSRVSLWLEPGEQHYQPMATEMTYSEPRVLHMTGFKLDFAAAFLASTAIHIEKLGRSISIPISGAAKAMPSMRQCLDDHLASWGIDPKAFNALRAPPAIGDAGIGWKDYPADAAKAGAELSITARIDVAASGRIIGCKLLVPSGWPSLDDKFCGIAMERGAMQPAVGADGNPTAAERVISVKFAFNHGLVEDRQFRCWQATC